MKKIVLLLAGLGIAGLTLLILRGEEDTWICENGNWIKHGKPSKGQPLTLCGNGSQKEKATMKITSSAFDHNQNIPQQYTCDGENISPPLSIGEVPATAKSLVLIVEDPDAPGGDFSHWLVWNIDPKNNEIAEGSQPEGSVSGTTDFRRTGYGGPCPPSGSHRYFFKVYALDMNPDLPESTGKRELLKAISEHILDQGELIGLYGR